MQIDIYLFIYVPENFNDTYLKTTASRKSLLLREKKVM